MKDHQKFRVFDTVTKEYLDMTMPTNCQTIPGRFELDQCTGLRDENGVLIFEGDICKTKEGESCFQIVHRHEQDEYGFVYHSGFCAKWEDGTLDKDYKFYESINDCEIIGNIHQNPELLKAQ